MSSILAFLTLFLKEFLHASLTMEVSVTTSMCLCVCVVTQDQPYHHGSTCKLCKVFVCAHLQFTVSVQSKKAN